MVPGTRLLKISSLLIALAVFPLCQSAHALQRTWNNTGATDFNATTSWSGTILGNVGAFTTAEVSQPNLTASISVAGLFFNAVSGFDLTSSSSAFSLTLTGTATTGGGTESSPSSAAAIASTNTSGTNTIDAALTLAPSTGSTSTFFQATGGTLVVNGAISGTSIALELNSSSTGGTIQLTGTNTYTGNTQITGNVTASVSTIGNSGANGNLGAGTTINFGGGSGSGTLLYTGSGETTTKIINLNGTTGGAIIDQSGASGLLKFTADLTATGASSKTLTLQGSTAGTGEISGAIVDNSGTNKTSLTKAGTGTWTLSGTNTYTGTTTINASGGTLEVANNGSTTNGRIASTATITVNSSGTLLLSGSGSADRINNSAGITLGGGTLAKGSGVNEGSTSAVGMGALTLTATGSKIDYTSTAGTLTFTSFTPSTFTLSIIDYIGTGSPGGTDQLIFNQDQATRLGSFDFGFGAGVNVAESNLGGGFFEVYSTTPVPEPSTWIGGALALLAVGLMTRKRFIKKAETLKA
jgi:autotransporter-associated beta strand protein